MLSSSQISVMCWRINNREGEVDFNYLVGQIRRVLRVSRSRGRWVMVHQKTASRVGCLYVGFIFFMSLTGFMANEALAQQVDQCLNSPPTFLQVNATDGTCQAGGIFIDGGGDANCTVSPNGVVNCTCEGPLLSVVIPDDCPPSPQGQVPGTTPRTGGSPFDTCGAIIGNNFDQCCIVGAVSSPILTTNTHTVATPQGTVKFQ